MPREILFLDKDETLGDWGKKGLYTGSKEFLRLQYQQDRELHILTTSGDASKVHVSEIEKLLSSYIGADQIASRYGFYQREDGTIGSVEKEYVIVEGKLIHQETATQFSDDMLYKNPYSDEQTKHPRHPIGILKDVHLARRLLSQDDYENLHTVMVGDDGDELRWICSDPYTPLFSVRRDGAPNFKAANIAVNALFGDGTRFPWQNYDKLAQNANSISEKVKTTTIEGVDFQLRVGENGSRVISLNYK